VYFRIPLKASSIFVLLLRCLHSLSRSVQQLRTSFHDHAVWKPLMKVSEVAFSKKKNIFCRGINDSWQEVLCRCCTQLLQNAPDEVLVMASSTLCNLLLEFSPSKEVRALAHTRSHSLTLAHTRSHSLTGQENRLRYFITETNCLCWSAAHPGVGGDWVTMQSDPERQSCTEGQWDLGSDGKKRIF